MRIFFRTKIHIRQELTVLNGCYTLIEIAIISLKYSDLKIFYKLLNMHTTVYVFSRYIDTLYVSSCTVSRKIFICTPHEYLMSTHWQWLRNQVSKMQGHGSQTFVAFSEYLNFNQHSHQIRAGLAVLISKYRLFGNER